MQQHFNVIAEREGFPVGVPAEYDEEIYQHQVPGGMISNLAHQLGQVGKQAHVQEALEETSRVRVEFGYPIMVTPLSQSRKRGGDQRDRRRALQGGDRPGDPVLPRALWRGGGDGHGPGGAGEDFLDRPRAREIMAQTREHPSLADMRRALDGESISDEELLLRWLLAREDIAEMRKTGPAKPYATTRHPLVALMASLMQSANGNLIQISKPGFSLKLERKAVHS